MKYFRTMEFLRRVCTCHFGEPQVIYKYDVFVAFSKDQQKFVWYTLLPQLENKNGLKCCIPDRDSYATGYELDNVCENMTESRTILILLSNVAMQESVISFISHISNNHDMHNFSSKKIVYVKMEKLHYMNTHFKNVLCHNICLQYPPCNGRILYTLLSEQQRFFDKLVSKLMNYNGQRSISIDDTYELNDLD